MGKNGNGSHDGRGRGHGDEEIGGNKKWMTNTLCFLVYF